MGYDQLVSTLKAGLGGTKASGGTASQEVARLEALKEKDPDVFEAEGGEAALEAAREAVRKESKAA